MFVCQVRVMFTHDYPTIGINTNPTCLLNGSRFLNRNTTHLLNWSIVLTCLSDFIQKKKILVMNFSKMKMKFCNSVIISNAREVGKLLISPSAWCTLQGHCQMHRCVLWKGSHDTISWDTLSSKSVFHSYLSNDVFP